MDRSALAIPDEHLWVRLRAGARAAIAMAVAVGAFGVAFGVLAGQAGWGVVAPVVMSATTFAGGAQFAAATILAEGGGVGAAVLAAAMLNSRYLAMGVSVAPGLSGPWWRRLAVSHLVVDESWALARVAGGVDAARLVGAGAVLGLAWIIGTGVGAVAAGGIGDPAALGLDAAFPALFLALLAPALRDRGGRRAALAGGGLALLATPFAPPGVPLLIAGVGALAGMPLRGDPPPSPRRDRDVLRDAPLDPPPGDPGETCDPGDGRP